MQESRVCREQGQAFRYLQRLLPQAGAGEIAEALQQTDNKGLVADIVEAGKMLGTQFYRIEIAPAELAQGAATLPALQVSDTPRVFLRAKGKKVEVLCGATARQIALRKLSGEPTEFIIPSPRMTLVPLRGKKRVERVLSYLKTEGPLLRALLVYALAVEILSLAAPLAVQVLINTIGFGMMTQQLIVLSTILLIGLSGAAALKVLQQILVEHLSRRFFSRTVTDYSERLPLLRKGAMTHPIYRFFEVASVDKAFFILGLDLIALILQLLAATLLLAFYHPILLGFTLVMAVSSWLVVRLPFTAALGRSIAESAAKYELAEFLEGGGGDDLERLRLWSKWEEARRAGFRISVGQQAGLLAIQVLLSVALLFVGGALVIGGQLTLGQLVAAELVAGTALLSLSKLGKQLPKIYDLITSFEKLGGVVDLPFEFDANAGNGTMIPRSLAPPSEDTSHDPT